MRGCVTARPPMGRRPYVCLVFGRFKLAEAYVAGGDPAAAVEHLLHIVAIDRSWNEGAGRALLLKVFEALGPAHPVAVAGRKKLAKLLFM